MSNLIIGIKHFVLGTVAVISAISPISNHTPVPTPSPTPVNKIEYVSRNGEYSFQGNSIKYTLNIPRNGGALNGSISGICQGPISGQYNGKEGGDVDGQASANCKLGFLNYFLKINYQGKLYLKAGQVDLNWEGKIPYTDNHGSFTINFDPVN